MSSPQQQIKVAIATTLLAVLLSISTYNTFIGQHLATPVSPKSVPAGMHTLFSKWKAIYGVTYHSVEENKARLKVFFDNFKSLALHRESNPKGVYNLNSLADISSTEFMKTITYSSKNGKQNLT